MSKYPINPQNKHIAFKSNNLKDALCALNPFQIYLRKQRLGQSYLVRFGYESIQTNKGETKAQ
jgi:hypothetical protein